MAQVRLYADLLNPIAELDGAGNVVSRFVYGDRGNVPAYLEKGGRTYRIVADPVGSVRLVVDVETGAVAQRLDYGPFGQVLLDTNPGFQPFGFAGGLYDPQTKLIRFGVRDYDPRVGRWTAKDPLGFAGGDTNFYAYVANDPINRADPSGQILPALALGYAAFEVALTLYDLYDAWDTVTDPCADLWDKGLSVGGLGLGLALPGGGYGVGAKAGRRALFPYRKWERRLPFNDPDRLSEVNKTLDRIETNGPFPHRRDGIPFQNREGRLPAGDYREYTVNTPGASNRGSRRVVVEQGSGRVFYTDNHYQSFIRIDPRYY